MNFSSVNTSSWLSYGKLRFSWGENGNRDIGIYAALAELTSNPTCWIDGNGKFYTTTYTEYKWFLLKSWCVSASLF